MTGARKVSDDQRYVTMQFPPRWDELTLTDQIGELMKLRGRIDKIINALEIDAMYKRHGKEWRGR